MKTLTALLLSLTLYGCASTGAAQREIQAAIDSSIAADRRHDLAARLELLTPDFEVVTLDGRVLRRAEVERGIAEFQQSTIEFRPATRTTIEKIVVSGDVATVFTNQHLVRTVRGPAGSPVERISNIRHRETWVRTPGGWKTKRVEETEQGPVAVAGAPVPFDAAGTAFVRKIRTEGIAAAIAAFEAQPNAVLFDERTLNAAGYALLGEGRNADAIEVFKLNVRAYPRSANVYDSLAEAYLKSGDKSSAAQWYRETLRRSPADSRVRATLQQLGTPVSDDELAAMLREWVPADVELRPDLVYTTRPRPLRLHVLLPRNTATRRPAILFIHGGGWTEGTRERGLPSLIHFVQKGYVAASIEYRLSGEAIFPAQIEDVRAAIEYLRAHANELGIDPRRVAVWGQSAGGHLAALAGTSLEGAARPDAVIDWNGPTDFLEPRELARLEKRKVEQGQPTFAMERLLGGPVHERRELAAAANPIRWVTPDDPPFLILHGSGDQEVSIGQSELLRDALAKAGVEVTLTVFPGEGHFGVGPLPPPDRYYAPMDEFLAKHFGRTAPLVDYHQHLVSPGFAPIVKMPERDGAALVRELDAAGIERAVVLSVGYSFADERKALPDPDRLTREQNDWTSAEVTKHARRLIGFCSANPLRPVALEELERCLGLLGMTGIKVHLGNAGITLRDPAHLARMQQLFALAQRRRAPVLIHMRARGGSNYGAEDAHLLLDKIVPTAPDIEIVVAHLGASGPGYSPQHDEVMAVFGAAVERNDPRMNNIYFDVSSNVTDETTPADAALVAQRIRQVGLGRVLYGSDLSVPGGSIARGWEIFRTKLALTPDELQQIASNRTRFAR